MIGKVKWFDTERGHGFIEATEESNNRDVFVHYSNIIEQEGFKDLEKGQSVVFDMVDNGRGPAAQNVRVVEN